MPSAVTSIIGGVQGASAAKNAAAAQAAGYNAAASRVDQGTQEANAKIDAYASGAGRDVRDASANEGDRVLGQAAQGATNLANVAGTGARAVTDSATMGGQSAIAAGHAAAAGVDPYAQIGAQAATTLGSALATGGRLNRDASASDILAQDPGYQFRLQQGAQALERAQAASGALGGGGAMKAAARYGQGIASDEYGRAFDRYTATGQNLYNNLSGVAQRGQAAAEYQGSVNTDAAKFGASLDQNAQQFGAGLNTSAAANNAQAQNAAQQFAGGANINGAVYAGNANIDSAARQGSNTINDAQYAGNSLIGAAGAKANGMLGSAAAWNGMLSGIGSAANSAIAGGFGGGGGFSLGGALSGIPQQAIHSTGDFGGEARR